MNTPSFGILRAKSLLLAASFAFTFGLNFVLADGGSNIDGLVEVTRAAEELRPHQHVRLIVFQLSDHSPQAAVFFEAGGFTFGYSSHLGSRYLSVRLSASPANLVSSLCHRRALYAEEQSVPPEKSASGQCPNGCLIDSLVHYHQLPSAVPDANWEGIFFLFAGPTSVGGDHAVLIYLRGEIAWVYDPCGCRTLCLGKIDLNRPAAIASQIWPNPDGGGWLVARDLAWLRRHGMALN